MKQVPDDVLARLATLERAATPGPWEVEWYRCRANQEDVDYEKNRELKPGEVRRDLRLGDEMWRDPLVIGPIGTDHNHWSGTYLTCSKEDIEFITTLRDIAPALIAELQKRRKSDG